MSHEVSLVRLGGDVPDIHIGVGRVGPVDALAIGGREVLVLNKQRREGHFKIKSTSDSSVASHTRVTHLLVLGPSDPDASRANLHALHLLNGSISILFPAEGDKAVALGPAGAVVPHDAGIPVMAGRNGQD